ncbi:MAG: ShlB/FhaC/HecB family hemolysin secretion/activation protein [Limnobacter sp.]|uniref:ShlB/FhaC/HecB family hemolysin secretion/activation protein n=1 Tax=Limnobacter sp. TaxID=2003368 RepID=UPI0032F019F0
MCLSRISVVLLLAVLSSQASAQVSTPAPFLNPEPAKETRNTEPEPDIDNQTGKQPAPELGKPMNDVSIDVARYRIDGVDDRHLDNIEARLQPYVGVNRSFEDLSSAAQVVTAYLQRELGLYLAYAYLPAQDIKNGVVTIAVLPGVLESVEVVWPAEELRVNKEIVQAHLNRLKPGSVIRVDEVERVVFLLNDLRGIRMSFAIKPGTQPGKAILVATPSNDRALTGSVGLDANGSRYAGIYRGIASMSWESPLGLGDSLSVSYLQSETGGLDFTLLGYTLPVGSNGLKLGVNASTVNYKLNDNDFPLGLNGDAESIGAFALYPVIRSRNLNLFALAGYDKKEFTDRQSLAGLETVKEVDSFRLGFSGDSRDSVAGGGLNFFNLTLEESKVNYPAGVPFGLDDELKAMRVNYSLGRLQSIVPGKLMLWGLIRGQHAMENLDSSEQCSLGGATAVRAFAQGETSGDSCDLFTLEARYLPSANWFGSYARELSFNVFYDQGRVRLREDTSERPSGFDNHAELAGYGIGVAWDRADVFTFNLSLAWELAGVRRSDPKRQSPRIFASYVYYF